jgi:hypothetical protein
MRQVVDEENEGSHSRAFKRRSPHCRAQIFMVTFLKAQKFRLELFFHALKPGYAVRQARSPVLHSASSIFRKSLGTANTLLLQGLVKSSLNSSPKPHHLHIAKRQDLRFCQYSTCKSRIVGNTCEAIIPPSPLSLSAHQNKLGSPAHHPVVPDRPVGPGCWWRKKVSPQP